MALGIPLPGSFGDSFSKGLATGSDVMQRMIMNPYDIQMKQAQAQHEQAQAQQSLMLSKLLGLASGDNGMPQSPQDDAGASAGSASGAAPTSPTAPGVKPPQIRGGGMDMNKALMLSGALKLPTQVVNGTLITSFGNYKVGESKEEERKGQTQEKGAEETLKSTSESALGGLGVNASFQALDKLMDNPNYKNIAGTLEGKTINAQPLGIPVGAMLQKNFPGKFSQEDADLAGQASAHMGNIVTGVAAKFKGPFKQMVNNIINNMKPNMGDSIATQKAKVKALQQLSNLADQQNGAIAQYINQGMDPTAAILRVAHESDFPSQINSITTNANAPAAAPEKQNAAPEGIAGEQKSPTSDDKPIVIAYKNGKEYHIPPKLMKQALAEGFSLEK